MMQSNSIRDCRYDKYYRGKTIYYYCIQHQELRHVYQLTVVDQAITMGQNEGMEQWADSGDITAVLGKNDKPLQKRSEILRGDLIKKKNEIKIVYT